MSREIDPDAIKNGTLTWDEAEYARVRGMLPDDYEMPDRPDVKGVEPPLPRSRVLPLEQQDSPTIGRNGGIVDEDEEAEDYDEGWSNDQRRAELSKRELSVNGAKAELMARLIRSDNDELLPEDSA